MQHTQKKIEKNQALGNITIVETWVEMTRLFGVTQPILKKDWSTALFLSVQIVQQEAVKNHPPKERIIEVQ